MDNDLSIVFSEIGASVAGMLEENKREIERLYLKTEKDVPISVSVKIGKDRTTTVKVKCVTSRLAVERKFVPNQAELEV